MSLIYTNAVFQCPVPEKPVARLVMLVLADHADENGESYPSIRRIVEMTRATRRSVQYAIRDLERAGLIRSVTGGRNRDGSGKRSSRYRIQLSQLTSMGATIAPIGGERAQPLHPMGATIAPLRAQPLRLKGATIAPEPSLNRHIEPSDEPPSPQGEGAGDTFGDSITAEMIFASYPRRVEKAEALKAIREAITAGNAPARLLERVRAYAAAVARWPEGDRRYVPHPPKWFRAASFDDDPREWERSADRDGQKSTSSAAGFGWSATEDELRARGYCA